MKSDSDRCHQQERVTCYSHDACENETQSRHWSVRSLDAPISVSMHVLRKDCDPSIAPPALKYISLHRHRHRHLIHNLKTQIHVAEQSSNICKQNLLSFSILRVAIMAIAVQAPGEVDHLSSSSGKLGQLTARRVQALQIPKRRASESIASGRPSVIASHRTAPHRIPLLNQPSHR